MKRKSKGKNRQSPKRREPGGERVGGNLKPHSTHTSWTIIARSLFSIDPRSLALFRIAMGALLLIDLAVRATDLHAMYTDGGMFSRMKICHHYTDLWNWSFHFGGGSVEFQAMLFGVAACLGLALLVGYETRLAAIGSWLMLVSIQHRVPPILHGGDSLLRMLLFWAMFLPLARAWSLDGWLERRRLAKSETTGELFGGINATPICSAASAGILIQMALMYLFSAIFKSNTEWFQGGVIAGTLSHDFFAKPLGAFFLDYPALLTAMTFGVFILEWAGPLLLFSPKHTARVRMAVIAALAAMHLAIALCMALGLFSFVSIAGLALFLPAEFWDNRFLARFIRPQQDMEPVQTPMTNHLTPRPAWAYAKNGACLALLAYVIGVNINGLPSRPLSWFPPLNWHFLKIGCGLEQKWNMFEDAPSMDGWYVGLAKLKDGSEVDLLRQGAEADWNRPYYPAGLYPNNRWRKCFREMTYEDAFGYQVFREPVAAFLCREWNRRNPQERSVVEFDFIFCKEMGATETSSAQITMRKSLVHLDFDES